MHNWIELNGRLEIQTHCSVATHQVGRLTAAVEKVKDNDSVLKLDIGSASNMHVVIL